MATTTKCKSSMVRKRVAQKNITKDTKLYNCPFCNKNLPVEDFYKSSDPRVKTGITRICKQCATDIARRKDDKGEYHEETRQSVQDALEYLDKPFIEDIWTSSYLEVNHPKEDDKVRQSMTIWGSYIKNINLPQYKGLRWKDSDLFKNMTQIADIKPNSMYESVDEIKEAYAQNRKDIIKIIGYDPFDDYPVESDKPLLYSQLVNFLDEETKNDAMKLIASIQIVKSQAQVTKINNAIDVYSTDVVTTVQNNAVIKNLSETASKLIGNMNSLAKENGISITNNNNKSKGAFTLSGKQKTLQEIGLREAEINTFDYGTCEGMRQVAEISEAARHKQIGYDENIAQEIKDIKVELVEKLTRERDEALERARILLIENKDLKDFLIEKKLLTKDGQVVEY